MTTFNESTVEAAALEWLEGLGWQVVHGRETALVTNGSPG